MDQAVGEPQQDEADPREPDDRQGHSQKPERAGHPGDSAPDARTSPSRPPARARSSIRSSSIRWATNPKGSEARRSISGVAKKITSSVGCQRQLERELKEEHRADRQVGAREEPVLPDREPLGARSLEQRFACDQEEEHKNQDEDRVFEKRDEPPAEEFLHAEGEQLFLPLALDLTARPPQHLGLFAQAFPGRRPRALARSVAEIRSCSAISAWSASPAALARSLRPLAARKSDRGSRTLCSGERSS